MAFDRPSKVERVRVALVMIGFLMFEVAAVVGFVAPAVEHGAQCGIRNGACLATVVYAVAFALAQLGLVAYALGDKPSRSEDDSEA
jgi:hypothetical protein